MSKERRRRPKGECTIPPAFPPDVIGEFVLKRADGEERAIREYVEWQARGEKVTHAEKIMTERLRDRRLDAWDVRTNKERYWVITNPGCQEPALPGGAQPAAELSVGFADGIDS